MAGDAKETTPEAKREPTAAEKREADERAVERERQRAEQQELMAQRLRLGPIRPE